MNAANLPPSGRAVVLGGGGASGMAWMVGLLLAVQEAGIPLDGAQSVIGTSGGATAAVLLRTGALEEAFDLLTSPDRQPFEATPTLTFAAFAERIGQVTRETADQDAFVDALFEFAATSTVDPEARRRTIGGRIRTEAWPEGELRIPALARSSRRRRVFTAADGAPLADVVLASSAVPGVWPLVTIDGEDYIDSAVLSATHVDLADGYERVLVLRPVGNLGGAVIPAEQDVLGRALVVEPDEDARAAFGADPLSPAFRAAAAEAGRRQGKAIAPDVRQYWAAE